MQLATKGYLSVEEALTIVNAVKPSAKYRHISRVQPYVDFLSGLGLLRCAGNTLFPTLLTCAVTENALDGSLPSMLHNVLAAVPTYRLAMQAHYASSMSVVTTSESSDMISPDFLSAGERGHQVDSVEDALERTNSLGAVVVWTPSEHGRAGNHLRMNAIRGLIEGAGSWVPGASAGPGTTTAWDRAADTLQADGWPIAFDSGVVRLMCPVTFVVRINDLDQMRELLGAHASALNGMDVGDLMAGGAGLRIQDNPVRACLVEPNEAVEFHDWARARFNRPVPHRVVPVAFPQNDLPAVKNPYCPGTWLDAAHLMPGEPPWHYLYRGNAFVWALWHLMVMDGAEISDDATPLYRSRSIPGVQLLEAVGSVLTTVGAEISTHTASEETVTGLLSLVRNTGMLKPKASGAFVLDDSSVSRLSSSAVALTDRRHYSKSIVGKALYRRSYG
jgi:hypothetical protein